MKLINELENILEATIGDVVKGIQTEVDKEFKGNHFVVKFNDGEDGFFEITGKSDDTTMPDKVDAFALKMKKKFKLKRMGVFSSIKSIK